MPNLGPTELIIIAVLVILLFGAKKLPDAARSLGRSMRIFKSEVKEMQHDDQPQAQLQQYPYGQAPQQGIQQPGMQNPQGYAEPMQQQYPNQAQPQYPNQQYPNQAQPQYPNQQYPQNPAQ